MGIPTTREIYTRFLEEKEIAQGFINTEDVVEAVAEQMGIECDDVMDAIMMETVVARDGECG